MITDPGRNWYYEKLRKFSKDKTFNAETLLYQLTEKIIEIHGQNRGRYKFYMWVLEFFAEKLIYRKRGG